MNEFFRAYVKAALWDNDDDNGNSLDKNHDIDDIDPNTLAEMRQDCETFFDENHDEIDSGLTKQVQCSDREYAGHDFWLTRTGSGCGFSDGDWAEPQATKLTAAAKAFGEYHLYVGDDGKIYGGRG